MFFSSSRQAATTTARSLTHHTARNSSSSSPIVAFRPNQAGPNVLRCDTYELRMATDGILPPRPPHTEQTWEGYGFEKKECGWGAWYLVP